MLHTFQPSTCSTKMKFSIKELMKFFSKSDHICSFLRIWSHLLKKCLLQNFVSCVGRVAQNGRFVMNLLCLGGSTMVANGAKTLDCRLSKSPKNSYFALLLS